jgi:hypothetical protein
LKKLFPLGKSLPPNRFAPPRPKNCANYSTRSSLLIRPHPWHKSFTQFLEDHKDETAYRGETSDGYSFVFYPRTSRGMWYRFDKRLSGVGIISEKTMNFLTQLVK